MEKMQEISNYIGNMKIRKTIFGGYDREDVFAKMQELVKMFQDCLKEEQDKQDEIVEEYELRIRSSQMMVAELNRKISELSGEQKKYEAEKEKMKDAYKDYCTNMLQQYSDSLKTLSAEFTQIMDNITKLQQSIIEGNVIEKLEVKIEEEEIAVVEEVEA